MKCGSRKLTTLDRRARARCDAGRPMVRYGRSRIYLPQMPLHGLYVAGHQPDDAQVLEEVIELTTMIAWRKGPCAEFPWSRVAFPRFLVAVRIGRAWLQAFRGTAGQWKVAVCLQRRLDRHGVHPVLGPHIEPCLHVQPATARARPVASPVARAAGISVQGHLHNAGNGEDHIREGAAPWNPTTTAALRKRRSVAAMLSVPSLFATGHQELQ